MASTAAHDGTLTATRTTGTVAIADVRCFPTASRLLRPFVTSRRRTEAVDAVLVEVELTDGTVGQGTAAETIAVTGASAETIIAAVTGPLASALRGAAGGARDLSAAVQAALPGATSAKAATEVALHDAWSRALGLPLATALGGSTAGGLAGDMTISLEDASTMATRAAEAAAAGWRILKIKLGDDPAADRERLRAVAAAAPQARLRLDANQGWTSDSAVRIIRDLEDEGLPVDLVEQPVPKTDRAGLAWVAHNVATPIMADEALSSTDDALEMAADRAVGLFNIKLAKYGGLRPALAIADIAQAAGIECMVGSMMEPKVSITAALHLAVAHPAVTMLDLDAPEWYADPAPAGGYTTEDGVLRLTGGPGLGLDRLRAGD